MKRNDSFYTVKELSRLISISEGKIRRMIQERSIPVYQFGKQYRFDIKLIDRWLQAQRVA